MMYEGGGASDLPSGARFQMPTAQFVVECAQLALEAEDDLLCRPATDPFEGVPVIQGCDRPTMMGNGLPDVEVAELF